MKFKFIISIAFISFFIFCSHILFGQKKYEKESRLRREAVPEEALQFVEQLGFKKRIKWHREQGLDRTSIEAKTKQQGKRYSIEFSPDGKIEDIEIKIKIKEIPEEVRCNIKHYFDTNHQKVIVKKTQIQYSGRVKDLIATIQSQKVVTGIATKYEMVVKAKTQGKYQMLEYLFDDQGKKLKQAEIILRNSDNLEY